METPTGNESTLINFYLESYRCFALEFCYDKLFMLDDDSAQCSQQIFDNDFEVEEKFKFSRKMISFGNFVIIIIILQKWFYCMHYYILKFKLDKI